MKRLRRILRRVLRWLHRTFIPTIQRGNGGWCGRFVIISAPPNISQWLGRGEIGLEWFRWLEKPFHRPPYEWRGWKGWGRYVKPPQRST